MKTKVLKKLKPEIASLGFSDEDLTEAVDTIAAGLKDDASDDDIANAVKSIVPFLKVSQKAVTRIVNAKKKEEKPDQHKPEHAEEPTDLQKQIEATMNKVVAPITEELRKLKTEKANNDYLGNLRTKFKDVDKEYFEMAIDGRTFNSQEEVDAFSTSLETKWTAYSQRLANDGLARLSKPAGGTDSPKDDKPNEQVLKRIEDRKTETVAPVIKGLETK
ncbi:MAG: hypothetical protein A2X18_07685 [Bacteroidetes bacterium GWF2_40_14]|nr:MAG: hypothetical protein A2X18_07685 [Bacteroidetes bacterium GWF2_40_14]